MKAEPCTLPEREFPVQRLRQAGQPDRPVGGRRRLGLGKRALSLPEKQASAAAGQSALMRAWSFR